MAVIQPLKIQHCKSSVANFIQYFIISVPCEIVRMSICPSVIQSSKLFTSYTKSFIFAEALIMVTRMCFVACTLNFKNWESFMHINKYLLLIYSIFNRLFLSILDNSSTFRGGCICKNMDAFWITLSSCTNWIISINIHQGCNNQPFRFVSSKLSRIWIM